MTSGSPSSHVTAGFLNTDWNPATCRRAPPPATSCCAPPTAPPPPDRSTCPPAPARHRGVRDASARVHGLSLPDSRYRRGRLRGLVAGSPLGRQRPAAGARNRPAGRGRRLTYLRGQGFKRIVLLGNSGGAGLYAFYTQSACRRPSGSPARPAASAAAQRTGHAHGRRHGADRPPSRPGRAAAELHRSVRRRRERRAVGRARTGPAGARQWLPARRPRRYAPAFVERYRERSASAWRAWTSRRGG